MELSIIIVNWNSKEYLKNCISSIFSTTNGIEFEILVIDNGSFDGCDENLRKSYPQVRFIQSVSNIGFAKANNEAFKVSRGSVVLFLNPDTCVVGHAIRILLHSLAVLPHAGIAGAKLLNTNNTIQTTCIRRFPNIFNQVLDSDVLQRLFPRSHLWGIAPLLEEASNPVQVEAVSGACLMIKRATFEDIGMFSSDYFMYSEDIDLCYKVFKAGWKCYFVPNAIVVHHGGGSSSQNRSNTFSSVLMIESRWRFFKKTRSVGYCRIYRFGMFMAAAIRTCMILALSPFLMLQGEESSMRVSLVKWIAIMRWTLGKGEGKSVKNY